MTSRAILPAFLFGFLFFFFEDVLAVPIFFDAFAELFAIAVALAFCAAAFLTASAIIESTAPDGSEKYIMRDYNGRIAVFVYGEDEPQEVFDVFTSSLPRGEAERVYKGITVEGDEALQKLIEDFTG